MDGRRPIPGASDLLRLEDRARPTTLGIPHRSTRGTKRRKDLGREPRIPFAAPDTTIRRATHGGLPRRPLLLGLPAKALLHAKWADGSTGVAGSAQLGETRPT